MCRGCGIILPQMSPHSWGGFGTWPQCAINHSINHIIPITAQALPIPLHTCHGLRNREHDGCRGVVRQDLAEHCRHQVHDGQGSGLTTNSLGCRGQQVTADQALYACRRKRSTWCSSLGESCDGNGQRIPDICGSARTTVIVTSCAEMSCAWSSTFVAHN